MCSQPGRSENIAIDNACGEDVDFKCRETFVKRLAPGDYDCQEKVYRRLDPGETWTQDTFAAHPWRVRDENGDLLLDFVPDGEDRTVYVSVP